MIVSDYHLDMARRRAILASRRSYAHGMKDDAPASVKLLVHVAHARALPPNRFISACLFLQEQTVVEDSPVEEEDAFSPENVDADVLRPMYTSTVRLPENAQKLGGGAKSVDDDDSGDLQMQDSSSSPRSEKDGQRESGRLTVSDNGREMEEDLERWQFVERLYINRSTGEALSQFGRELPLTAPNSATMLQYKIRLQFYLFATNPATGEESETSLGYASTTLQDILDGTGEQTVVNVVSMDDGVTVVDRARFGVKWVLSASLLAFEIRIRVNRKHSWPFQTTKPFFMIYRREFDGQWTPLYLSEVRVKPTDHPLADNSMLYTVAEVPAFPASASNDILRLEFFHYKTSHKASHELLGSVTTSVVNLRQAKPKDNLKLHLSTFPNMELVGSVSLRESRVSAARSFFSLQACFGGPVQGHFVYLDVSMAWIRGRFRRLAGHGHSRTWVSQYEYRLIRVEQETNVRDEIYRSEAAARYPGSKRYKYRVAKITEEKLKGGRLNAKLVIGLYAGQSTPIGYVKTSLDELLGMPPRTCLPIGFVTVGNQGFVQLERRENKDNISFLALRIMLGKAADESSSEAADSGAAEIEDPTIMTTIESQTGALFPTARLSMSTTSSSDRSTPIQAPTG